MRHGRRSTGVQAPPNTQIHIGRSVAEPGAEECLAPLIPRQIAQAASRLSR